MLCMQGHFPRFCSTELQVDPAATSQPRFLVSLLRLGFIFLVGCALVQALPKSSSDDAPKNFSMRVEASPQDVRKAVQEVSQDQIIHGTYSYEKERILYGAHSAAAAHVFGPWKGPGTAFYKVAQNVLAPRFFKDTGDVGTVSIRYIVQEAGPDAAILKIDAIFVDARNVKHPSLGPVESSEYTAIQQHLRNIQQGQTGTQVANGGIGSANPSSSPSPLLGFPTPPSVSPSPAAPQSPADLQKKLDALRRQVELRVKDPGAPLKSAPFQSSTTIESVPAQTEVLIVVLTPYWYGVETEDGHRGWIHHSQLEPLP